MFRRTIASASSPAPSARKALDKMLPMIPFTPDWSDTPAPTGDCAQVTLDGAQQSPSPGLRHLPLILAEPDPVSSGLICDLGRNWGYDVVAVNDGLEVFAAICAQKEPALAVINWRMSGMDGIEICRATRELNRPVYIVIVTDRSGAEQLNNAVEAGADDYLITPFDADELRARLRVGARVIDLQAQLNDAKRDLAAASEQIQALTAAAKASRLPSEPQ
jgi:CheY-like chemotaxis protein